MLSFLLPKINALRVQTVRTYCTNRVSNTYVTTPIFYVNGDPHIGHLYTAVLADVIARYKRMQGHSVFLSTGTDEHGNKVHNAAKGKKLEVSEYCTCVSQEFKEMCNKFQINYTRFIRTTERQHQETVYHFWNVLKEKDQIYLGKYSGWYCTADEEFLADSEITESKTLSGDVIKVSSKSGNPVEWTEENNYKFRLRALQDDLKHWLKDEQVVKPKKFHEMLSQWVEEGICLEDLSISRPTARVTWAIPTPDDSSQSIYVWLDALVNYLTSVGYPDGTYKRYWPPAVQIIGKDILKFHGIYWPAFLIAAGLEPPKTLLCHSHWLVHNEKMSKSKGNVVSPFRVARDVTEDGLRYFLLREAVLHKDANYDETKLQRILNSELVNNFSNLVHRCSSKALNPTREIPDPIEHVDALRSDIAVLNMKKLSDLAENAQRHYEEYSFHQLVDSVMDTLHTANQIIEFHKPWELAKNYDDTDSSRELKAVISLVLENVRIAALILHPIVPNLTGRFLDHIMVPREERTWNDIAPKFSSNSVGRTKYMEGDTPIIRRIKLQ